MAIVINGSGTVTGISVGGLPDGIVDAGTLATNSVDSAELIDGAVDDSHMAAMAASKLTGALPAISGASLTGITTGKVLQVVSNSSHNYTSSSTADTWIATNHYVDITPSATSSKILATWHGATCYQDSGSTNFYTKYTLFRDSTNLGDASSGFGGIYSHSISFNDKGWNHSMQNLDSPSSTSSLRYRVYFRQNAGHHYHDLDGYSTLTLMEIAG